MKLNYLLLMLCFLSSLLGFDYRYDNYEEFVEYNNQTHTYFVGRVMKKYYTQYATWTTPPLVKVCEFAPVTREEVEDAMKWWEDRGYTFDGLMYGVTCLAFSLPGHIIIDIHNQSSFPNNRNDLGTTFTYVKEGTTEILGASIHLLTMRDRVLEHEIGHALGWNHIGKIGHMMNATWSHGGWKDDDLDRQCKIKN